MKNKVINLSEILESACDISLAIACKTMFYTEIHPVEGQEKTSNDATTRLSIIFSARNDDIYILRVDLPHKGEKSFHINMEEVVGDKIIATGYPIDLRDAVDLREKLDEKYNELFFEMDGKAWFRSEFKSLLKKIELSRMKRKN